MIAMKISQLLSKTKPNVEKNFLVNEQIRAHVVEVQVVYVVEKKM